MKGVILAAGGGTRLAPLTNTRAKPAIPVANRPLIEHIIASLKGAGIEDIVIIVNTSGELEKLLEDGSKLGVKLKYVVQEEQLGTAHAISLVKEMVTEPFILVNGDNLVPRSVVNELVEKFNGTATITLLKAEDLSSLSTCELDGNKVLKIIEKPKSGEELSPYASIGTYAFSPEIFDYIDKVEKSPRGEYELPSAMDLMLRDGKEMTWVETEQFQHLSHPWDMLSETVVFLDIMEEAREGTIEEGAVLKGKVSIGKGTVIKSGAYIEGPVLIGENCTIGPNCFIRAYTTIGNNCRVGNAVEIKNSVIFDGTNVPHLSYIGDSVIGENVNFGAGTVLANFRLDKKNIKMEIKGELVDTERKKLGAIVGDNTKFGSNVVVNPGRKIGANCNIWPGTVVTKDLDDGEDYK